MPDDVLTDEDVGLETETETPLLTDEEVGFKSPEQIQQPKPFTTLGTTEPYFGAYIEPPEQRRAEFVEGMFKPAVPLPRVPDVIKAPAGPVEVVLGNVMTPGGTIRNLLLGDQPGAEINRRILNFAVSLPEFFETPVGVLTAGLGALGKTAQTVISGVFSIDLLKNALKQSTDLVKNWRTMSPEQRAGAVVDILGTTTLGAGAGVHTATGIARMRPRAEPEAALPLEPPPIPPPPIPAEPTAPVPAAPAALPETAAGERALAQQIDAAAERQAATPVVGKTLPDYDPQDIGMKQRLNEKKAQGKTHDEAVSEISAEDAAVTAQIDTLPPGTRVRNKDGMLFENTALAGDKPDWVQVNENTGDWIINSVSSSQNLRGGEG